MLRYREYKEHASRASSRVWMLFATEFGFVAVPALRLLCWIGMLAAGCLSLVARWRWTRGDRDGAIRLARQAILADSSSVDGHVLLGWYGLVNGRFDPLPHLREAIARNLESRPREPRAVDAQCATWSPGRRMRSRTVKRVLLGLPLVLVLAGVGVVWLPYYRMYKSAFAFDVTVTRAGKVIAPNEKEFLSDQAYAASLPFFASRNGTRDAGPLIGPRIHWTILKPGAVRTRLCPTP